MPVDRVLIRLVRIVQLRLSDLKGAEQGDDFDEARILRAQSDQRLRLDAAAGQAPERQQRRIPKGSRLEDLAGQRFTLVDRRAHHRDVGVRGQLVRVRQLAEHRLPRRGVQAQPLRPAEIQIAHRRTADRQHAARKRVDHVEDLRQRRRLYRGVRLLGEIAREFQVAVVEHAELTLTEADEAGGADSALGRTIGGGGDRPELVERAVGGRQAVEAAGPDQGVSRGQAFGGGRSRGDDRLFGRGAGPGEAQYKKDKDAAHVGLDTVLGKIPACLSTNTSASAATTASST